jgi:hypothetical protein
MLLIYVFTAIGLAGFFSSLLMGVTVVGVCRYGDRYHHFFERLRKLGALATIKEMSGVYFAVLNKFLGQDVGLKQPGVLDKPKYFGLYIEHLLLLYWIGSTILVLAFRPVEPMGKSADSLQQAAAFVTLLSINIFSDALSLLWTKRCIAILAGMVPNDPLTTRRLCMVLAQDVGVAIILMFMVQLVSNGLYAIQVGRPDEFYKDMFDITTAVKLYHPNNPRFSGMQFPGQLVITCTTYLPSLLFYVTCLTILCLVPFYRLLFFIFSIFNLQSPKQVQDSNGAACGQLEYIGALVGVFGFGLASLTFAIHQLSQVPT